MGWTKLIGVAGVDSKANSVAVDGSGNVYVTGRTAGNLDGQTKTGTEDAFLIKYDSSGETLTFRIANFGLYHDMYLVVAFIFSPHPLHQLQGPGSGLDSKVVLAIMLAAHRSQLTAAAIASPWSATQRWRSTDRPTQAVVARTSSLFCSPPMGAPRGRDCLAAQETMIPLDTVLLSTAATTFTQWDTRSAVPSTDKL